MKMGYRVPMFRVAAKILHGMGMGNSASAVEKTMLGVSLGDHITNEMIQQRTRDIDIGHWISKLIGSGLVILAQKT